ncbi:F-box protein At5g49610-like [Juglans regia]|uniref:F-box protein At5g49610-like n=1 Tax=Juglans regia TaxID=51240 RepID=A0A6P9F8Y8_JUGRE|nr:F-box protein At5g49610-like [Juglans regia]
MGSPDLPSDIIFEILSRTSLKTLGRCALVCKDWNRMVYESSFMHPFCQRTKTISGFFMQSRFVGRPFAEFVSNYSMQDSNSKLSLDFLPRNVNIEAATKQGILLCVKKLDTKILRIPEYYVCKPSTKEWHKIPNPKTRYFTERLAMVVLRSQPLHYVIVRFSEPRSRWRTYNSKMYISHHCEIFYSETWAWKQLQDVLLPYDMFFGTDPAVSACGVLHWLMSNNQVFAFDKDTESWTTFDLPFPLCKKNYFKHTKLVEYNGHLAMLCTENHGEFAQLWVMVDSESKVWMKRQRMSIEAVRGVERYSFPVAMDSSDITLMRGFYSVIYYNFTTFRSKRCFVQRIQPDEVFPFQSDLEPAYLKNYWKKEQFSRFLCWVCLFICSCLYSLFQYFYSST